MTDNVPAGAPRGHRERRVAQVAKGMPGIEDLTAAQVDKIAQGIVVDELKAKMRRAIVAAFQCGCDGTLSAECVEIRGRCRAEI